MKVKQLFAALAASTLLVAGCSSGQDLPEKVDGAPDLEISESSEGALKDFVEEYGFQIDNPTESVNDFALFTPDEMMLVLYGSSSCPPDPTGVIREYDEENEVTSSILLTASHYDGACTADYAPHFYTVEPSRESSYSKELTMAVTFANPDKETEVVVIPAPPAPEE